MLRYSWIGLLAFVIGCSSCTPEVETDTTVVEDVTEVNQSEIHGGSPVPEEWADCSAAPGDHPCNFSFTDQFGDVFELYDNYGTVIVLDFSTMWCGVCQNIAPDVQTYQDEYGPEGFLWVTVLVDNASGEAPSVEDVDNWSQVYGIITSPVLAGDRSIIDMTGTSGYPISSWPTLVVIDREMFIYNGLHGWNGATITGWIETVLNQ